MLRPGAQTLTLPPQGVLHASGALESHVPVRIWVPRACTVCSCLHLPEPLWSSDPQAGPGGDGHFLPKDDGRGVLGPEVSLGSGPPHPLLRPSAPTLSARPRAERQTHLPALGAPGSSGSHSAAGHSRPRGASSHSPHHEPKMLMRSLPPPPSLALPGPRPQCGWRPSGWPFPVRGERCFTWTGLAGRRPMKSVGYG